MALVDLEKTLARISLPPEGYSDTTYRWVPTVFVVLSGAAAMSAAGLALFGEPGLAVISEVAAGWTWLLAASVRGGQLLREEESPTS